MNKEEWNKFVVALPCWIEYFIPYLYLSPQGLIQKLGKKDRLIFNASFLVNPHSKYVNYFTLAEDKINLVFQYTFLCYIHRIYNLHITYHDKELMTMDDDASNTYCHIKLYPDIARAHSFIIDKVLYIALGYIFGSNVVSYR